VVLSNLRYVKEALVKDGHAPEDAGEALDDATRSIERIVRVVRELNDAGRVVSRRVDVHASPCELDAVVAKCLTQLRTVVPDSPEVKVSGERGARASVDDALLVQVLLNVLANAALAVKDRPQPEIGLHIALEERLVHLSISDNGPGVSAEAMPHLFEPFFTTRPHGQGTGLGLPVSLGLISSQGGDLRLIETSPGGARFELTVPRA
jgi:C4-dicarboxylate-specific signal transduction histidine kinase